MLSGVDPGGRVGSMRLLTHMFREQRIWRRQEARQCYKPQRSQLTLSMPPSHPCRHPIHTHSTPTDTPINPHPNSMILFSQLGSTSGRLHILPQHQHQLGTKSSNTGACIQPYHLPVGRMQCNGEEEGHSALDQVSKLEICPSSIGGSSLSLQCYRGVGLRVLSHTHDFMGIESE